MTESNRIEEVDISKGIGMVLVITGHLCVGAPLRNFIYSFHMPLFFVLSGFVYNIARARTRKAIQIKKILAEYIEWSGVSVLWFLSALTIGLAFVLFIGQKSEKFYLLWGALISSEQFVRSWCCSLNLKA